MELKKHFVISKSKKIKPESEPKPKQTKIKEIKIIVERGKFYIYL